ncbi:MAG: hypothetical protein ACOCWI_04735 [Bacillota bacterium]
MGNSFFFIIAIIIIGSIISSIMKNNDAKKRNQNANRQTRPIPSPPQKREGIDLAKEIETSPLRTASSYKERVMEKEKTKTHIHPSSRGNIKVEKSYVEDSMGEHFSEGCEDHYYDRFVAVSEKLDEDTEVNTDIAKIIVLGEAINTPRFKKYRR